MRRFMISPCLKKGLAALALMIIPLVSIAHAGEPADGDDSEIIGEFYVKDVGLPTAYVFTVLPKPERVLTPTKLESVLGDLTGEGGDAEDAFEVGFNKANLALGVSSSVFSVADGVGAMTGASFFDGLKFDLGQAFTYAGYLSVAVQAVVDIRSGDERRLAVNLYKNISNIGVNLVAAGNVALSVALAGVFAIDLSLNWFGEESVNLRLDKGRQAYIAYMEDVRSDSEWRDFVYNRTESLAKEGRIDKLPGVLEDELRRLMEGFWTTSEADVILKAGGRRHSVMQRSEKQRITRDVELRIKRTLAEMVEELEAKQFQQLWRGYVAQVEKQRDLLNTKLRLTVREEVKEDEEPTMEGCRVRLGKLKSGVPQGAWEFTLDESGEGYLDMTFLGYLQAGMPTSVEVISPEKDEAEIQKVITKQPFELIGQNTLVALSPQEQNSLDWPGDFYGVVIPPPKKHQKIYEYENKVNLFGNLVITVRIDDMDWSDYVAYCRKLASLPGFSPEGRNKPFPAERPKGVFDYDLKCEGLDGIALSYFPEWAIESQREKGVHMPRFALFVYAEK